MTVELGQIIVIATPADGSPPRPKVFPDPAQAQAALHKGITCGLYSEIALCTPFQVWTKPEGEA